MSDVIRRYPDGRLTEAEATYVAGRILARKNGGFVPADMREWWLKIDAIAPAWLTGESILFKEPVKDPPCSGCGAVDPEYCTCDDYLD
jgi:hypothetical protein